jgi:hypothetical protein
VDELLSGRPEYLTFGARSLRPPTTWPVDEMPDSVAGRPSVPDRRARVNSSLLCGPTVTLGGSASERRPYATAIRLGLGLYH